MGAEGSKEGTSERFVKAVLDEFERLMHSPTTPLSQRLAAVAAVDPAAWSANQINEAFDQLALEVGPVSDADQLVAVVLGDLGFRPNTQNYYASNNSLIHRVLEKRQAIPLTLAIVATELGRRCDVDLTVVGMPGHALIGDGTTPTRWFDPFAAGAALDRHACQAIATRVNPNIEITDEMLAPLGDLAIVVRMLANLRAAYLNEGDLSSLASVLQRMVRIPGAPLQHRLELAGVLRSIGRDDQAADEHQILAKLDPSKAEQHRAASARLRASRN